jgi:tetratricopeptide (TPR) repeat protein
VQRRRDAFVKRLPAFCLAAIVAAVPARVFAQQKAFADALVELTEAIEGTYGDEGTRVAPALDRMSMALAGWNREIATAEAELATALRGASQAGIVERRLRLARMYAERARFRDALSELDAVVRVESRRADVHVIRGLALRASRRHAEAAEAFHAALSLDASDPVTAYYLWESATATSNAAHAQDARKALAAAYRTITNSDGKSKRPPFIRLATFPWAADRPPLLPLAAYTQPYRSLARGDYDIAIAELRKAASGDPLLTDPASRTPALADAVAALRQGRLAQARSLIERSGSLGGSSEANRILGLIYWAESDYEKSIEKLSLAIQLAPRDERARIALSRVLSSAGRDAEAAIALEETVRALPDSALAHWWLALSHERVNRFAEARREFAQAASGAVANESPLHAAVGRSASGAADVAGAIESFARAVAENPNDAGLHKLLAGSLVQQDRSDDALIEFVAALLIDPEDGEAYAGIGQIHLNAGRGADAVAALQRATEVAPANHDARYALASALVQLGRAKEAADHFIRVEQAQRQMLADRRRGLSHDVLKEEAALRASEGKLDAAISLYEKALAVSADAAVYDRLASLYTRVGRALDAARARAMSDKMRADGSTPR